MLLITPGKELNYNFKTPVHYCSQYFMCRMRYKKRSGILNMGRDISWSDFNTEVCDNIMSSHNWSQFDVFLASSWSRSFDKRNILKYNSNKHCSSIKGDTIWYNTTRIVNGMYGLTGKAQPLGLKNLLNISSVKNTISLSDSPGLPCIGYELYDKRSALIEYSAETLNKIYEFVDSDYQKINIEPTLISIRRHKTDECNTEYKYVYTFPFDMWYIETVLFWDLLQRYKCEKDIDYGTPFIKQLKEDDIHRNGTTFELVFKNFNKRVPSIIIDEALNIIFRNMDFRRLCFGGQLRVNYVRLFNLVRDYFINTPMRLPDGSHFVKTMGIPYGSVLTNLVESICNALMYVYIQGKYFQYKHFSDCAISASTMKMSYSDGVSRIYYPGVSPHSYGVQIQHLDTLYRHEFGMQLQRSQSNITSVCTKLYR